MFAELHTHSYQGRQVSLHVSESGDIGLVRPNLQLLQAPNTFIPPETDLLTQLENPVAFTPDGYW
ncbi:hypothetical protein [Serratia marcescens]|uniref:hypothetical protein n=1 Tax=Serratia marcescens TaxID=615 RepID=UPI000D80E8AD|nr:hypothetical protein [Serratia marcescens]EIJ6702378.1 hypothetical protein [Serratia marcescens]EIV5185142.1 hypothetical protein [Serratia marcescens]EIY2710705.1 hypothetical protein [Serratia marcescens]ELQ6281116.1 hypothetical protein [Serratia marcescens]EMF1928671.1 hypothetical protein [Serratia marcescens]